ncbi:ATP-binding cassette domain-containing protein [Massilia sp. B-10]|nr:ATP-binding cassette domain-containing protein [Massilia sp. B-10]
MIFQEPMSSLNPVFTVGFQIGEVLRQHMGMNARQARARTLALLDEVGIPDPARKIDAYPGQLSGGQQQRVMIAMAIACELKLLIADEPTTALDVTIQKQIMALIAHLQKTRDGGPVHHPRPGAGGRDRRPCDRDAPRRSARAGPGAPDLRRAAGRLHAPCCTAVRRSTRAPCACP